MHQRKNVTSTSAATTDADVHASKKKPLSATATPSVYGTFTHNSRIAPLLIPPLLVVLVWGGSFTFTTILVGICIAAVFDIFGKKEGYALPLCYCRGVSVRVPVCGCVCACACVRGVHVRVVHLLFFFVPMGAECL